MKEKITTACIALIGILAAFIFIGSVGAYEQETISGLQFFWQVMVALLLGLSAILLAFYRALLNDYTELNEELNDYLDVEEAEEIRVPDEIFEFTRTPELDERGGENV